MGKPAGAAGKALETGTLYRLVPNWDTHWDYERNLPEPRAFRKDGDVGVSMIWKERMPMHEVFTKKPSLRPFGVCEFAVEELVAEDGVWAMEDVDDDFGDAHHLVMGITKRRVDWLRELAIKRIVKFPDPAKPADRLYLQ